MSAYLRVRPGAPGADHAVDILWAAGAVAVGEGSDDRGAFLDAGFEDDARLEVAARSLAGHDVVVLVDDGSWWDGWRAFARPVVCGAVVVNPAWLPSPAVDRGPLVVSIDPGRSFGSGAHATTRLALELVQTLDLAAARVLDVGSGSGVLGIVAARLGAVVTALDTDPYALAATRANAETNGVADRVLVREEALDDVDEVFDVVVANVPTPTLVEIGPALVTRLAPAGTLVTTGFLAERAPVVTGALAPLVVVGRRGRDGWVALVLTEG